MLSDMRFAETVKAAPKSRVFRNHILRCTEHENAYASFSVCVPVLENPDSVGSIKEA